MNPPSLPIRARTGEYQTLGALKTNRRKRSKLGRFLVEGVRSIDQLKQGEWTIDAWVYSEARDLSSWARRMLVEAPARRHWVLSDELMQELSEKDETSELMAVVDLPKRGLEAIRPAERALIVVLDRPGNPGNLGTIIRSCDALGVDGVVICGHSADLFDPRTIRAAAGSLFALPVAAVSSRQELAAWLEGLRAARPDLQVVGSSASATTLASRRSFLRSTVLVVGSERSGISHALAEECDSMVSIPMTGSASSLNVSCAATVLLYEVDRQRQEAQPGKGSARAPGRPFARRRRA